MSTVLDTINNIFKSIESYEPKYTLILISIFLIICYFVLGKLFTFIGFIVSMYYIYRYWRNRENINKNIQNLFIQYENLFGNNDN